uniref:VWFA domain-containing protein n=1 Tax=Terrapene triunguis TaxID=2587831 RepID=A0A674KDA6_9SAUR
MPPLSLICHTFSFSSAFTKHYADIVFLVDSSVNMGSSSFEQIKNFIYQIVNQLDVGIDKYRVGLAQYSREGHVEFLLNTYKSKEDVLTHIQGRVTFLGGPLQTGSALEFLHKVFFKEEVGSRISQGTPQFAVVITSAKSKDDVAEAAEELKEIGVKVISVGVQNSDREEMEVIATSPLVYQVNGGQSISQLHQDITNVLEAPVQQQYDSALDAKVPAVCSSASVADIVFLVDESSRIGLRNFQLTRTFLLKIVNALDIGPNNIRVGLVLYSDEPRLEFTLDTFEDKSDILNYLKKLPYRGGRTYTGAAIDFLRKKVFTQEAGSRKNQGVQQLAVVITDGQSFDDFVEPSSKLRHHGVAVYAVGTKNISESSQLDKIASYPSRKHVTNLESFLHTAVIERYFTFPFVSSQLGCVDTEEADIYFLIDGSGSIYPNDFQDMKVFMNEMISMFQVSANGVRFGVVQYESTPQTEFMISQYNSVKQLKEAVRDIQQLGGGTNTGDALRYMKSLFAKAARDSVPKLLIVITDGESQDQVTKAAEELRQEGIVIYAIGVKNAVKKELKDIAGTEDRMFFVNDFDSLKLIKHDIVQDICSPDACKNMKADIILLVDSSESIRPVDFQKMKDFMQLIVNRSDIGADKVQIGLLQFSSEPQEEFQLNRYGSKADLRRAISGIRQIKSGTMTGKALTFASSYFDEPKGGRPRVKQYLIVITDGEAQDVVREPAETIRGKGITIYAIGVLHANNSQLVDIAGSQDKVFFEDNFDSLTFLEKEILFEICNPEDSCKRTEVADIIFVVHGSRNVTDLQFQGIQRIMEAVVNDSLVGKDNVQFGAVVYSTNPQDHFSLNTYSAKSQVREAISNLTPMPGLTFTARALNFARERFGMAYGGRTSSLSVTRILVLITDQPTSPSDRPNLPAAAKSLKQDGIHVFAVGVDEASRTELEEIVGERERLFFVQSYNELESLHKNLTHTVCDEAKPACGNQQADLIFLIDGSLSISARNFSAMKTFTKEIVDSFIIAQDKVQVGVVQYSKDPQKEIYLNEFHSDTAIKERIDSIVQLKTSTFTGKGLRFVKSFFETAKGGRKKQGVLQSLVVITNGQSNDVVDEAAIALRNDGIHVFAIGLGIPNSFELLRIAGDARRVYVLENFEVLKTIERRINNTSGDCNIDVSVGIDISRRMKSISALNEKQKLQKYLPKLLHRMESLTKISCTVESQINIRFKYQVFAQNGQSLFDSDFEAYDEEILQKFLVVQTIVDTYLNADFLESFWEKSLRLVLLVFTDGLDDTIEMLRTTADSLRIKGLDALLMVGLENMQDLNELQEIEFGRGFGYKQPLTSISRIVLQEMVAERKCCNVLAKCVGEHGFRGVTGPPGRKVSLQKCLLGERGRMGFNGTQGEGGCPGIRGPKASVRSILYPPPFIFTFHIPILHLEEFPSVHSLRTSLYKVSSLDCRNYDNIGLWIPFHTVRLFQGTAKCPVYPTELVFALDMSEDVTLAAFERMRDIVISLLRVIKLSESNCPTGARISIVSYNTNTRYLIRFSEFQRHNLLLEAVQRIPLERSSGRRNIGAAMRFIARNVFKRVRQGVLVRKVAIFFTSGPSQDATSINTAVLEFGALDITPVVIAFSEVPNVRRAFSVSWLPTANGKSHLQFNASCLDKCKPDTNCEVTVPPPVMVNMDITYVMDSSDSIDSDEFERAKDFVSTMLDHFVITSQPRGSDEGARVALVQQAPRSFISNRNTSPVNKEFDLITYSGKNLMKRHIQESAHQLEGPSAIGHALQWTIDNIFFKAPNPRQHRVIFTILGSKTSSWDRQKLREVSLKAKCQGFIMFTLALGNDITSSELTELSSFPAEQHLVQLGRVLKLEMAYAQKFSRASYQASDTRVYVSGPHLTTFPLFLSFYGEDVYPLSQKSIMHGLRITQWAKHCYVVTLFYHP